MRVLAAGISGGQSQVNFKHDEHTAIIWQKYADRRNGMELERLPYDLSVCKLKDTDSIDLAGEFFFLGKTDEEISLVCRTEDVPDNTTDRDDGWKGFRIRGCLDFSLIGILSGISGKLADNKIGIFAVSTYNTDYILVKKENFGKASEVLSKAGYQVI